MKKRYTMAGILVLLLVIAITAVACGSGDSTTSTAATTATTASPSSDTTAATTATTGGSTDTTGATPTSAAGGPATGEPILVGFSSSLTGAAAAPGISVQQGVDLQVELINNNGGINGRPIKIVSADDKSDVTTIMANMTKMAETDKVDAFIGPFVVYALDAARAFAEKAQIPLVGPGPSGLKSIEGPQPKWSVEIAASAPAQADALKKIIAKNGWKNILAMADILQIHQDTIDILVKDAAAGGYKITKMADSPGFDSTDATPFFNKIKVAYDSDKPDVIILYVNSIINPAIIKGLHALGVAGPIQMSPASAHPSIFAMGPDAVEGVLCLDNNGIVNPVAMPDSWPLKKLQVDFAAAYEAKYKTGPDTFAAEGADMILVLAEAMKRAGDPTDKAKVAAALMAITDFPTYEGSVTFAPEDNSQGVKGGLVEWTIKGGQFTDPQIVE
jgi:branched-chain amino acid transport system substrate-binding protein